MTNGAAALFILTAYRETAIYFGDTPLDNGNLASTGHHARQPTTRSSRQHRWDHNRVVRLLPVRHSCRTDLPQALLSGRLAVRGGSRFVQHPVRRVRRPAGGRRHLRPLRGPGGPQGHPGPVSYTHLPLPTILRV